MSLENLERHEAQLLVEANRALLRVDEHADTPIVVRESEGQLQDEAQELSSQALPMHGLIDSQTPQSQDWKRIARQLPPGSGWEIVDLHVPRRHGRKAENEPSLDSDVRRADVVTELVLAGVLLQEAVEGGIA